VISDSLLLSQNSMGWYILFSAVYKNVFLRTKTEIHDVIYLH